MRRLMNLKLWAIVALLWGGMSSCMNDDEDSANVYIQYPYMLQNDNGTYTPQMRLLGYDIESAYLSINSERFSFKPITEHIWELPKSGSYSFSLDTVTFGYYAVVATNNKGQTERINVTFYGSSKKIGEIHLNQFDYNSETKKLSVSLKTPVQNANYYYLMVKMPVVAASGITTGETMWIPFARLQFTEINNLATSVNIGDLSDGTFHFAIGASYETTFRISESLTVEIKNNANSKDPEEGKDKN